MVYIVVLIVPAREDKSARGRGGGGSRRVRGEDNFTVRRLTGSPFLVARLEGSRRRVDPPRSRVYTDLRETVKSRSGFLRDVADLNSNLNSRELELRNLPLSFVLLERTERVSVSSEFRENIYRIRSRCKIQFS